MRKLKHQSWLMVSVDLSSNTVDTYLVCIYPLGCNDKTIKDDLQSQKLRIFINCSSFLNFQMFLSIYFSRLSLRFFGSLCRSIKAAGVQHINVCLIGSFKSMSVPIDIKTWKPLLSVSIKWDLLFNVQNPFHGEIFFENRSYWAAWYSPYAPFVVSVMVWKW